MRSPNDSLPSWLSYSGIQEINYHRDCLHGIEGRWAWIIYKRVGYADVALCVVKDHATVCSDGSYNFFSLMQNFILENDGRIHAIQLDVASLNVEYIHLLVSVGVTALYRIYLTMPVYYMCDGVVGVQVCQCCQYRCVDI